MGARNPNLDAALDSEMARYQAAAEGGDVDTAVVFADEVADLINDLPPAGEIVTRLVADAELVLTAAAGRVFREL